MHHNGIRHWLAETYLGLDELFFELLVDPFVIHLEGRFHLLSILSHLDQFSSSSGPLPTVSA